MISDNELNEGDKVLARFTNNFQVIQFEGEVVGKTKNYIKVKNLHDGVNGWEKGHLFHIHSEARATPNNCVVEKIR